MFVSSQICVSQGLISFFFFFHVLFEQWWRCFLASWAPSRGLGCGKSSSPPLGYGRRLIWFPERCPVLQTNTNRNMKRWCLSDRTGSASEDDLIIWLILPPPHRLAICTDWPMSNYWKHESIIDKSATNAWTMYEKLTMRAWLVSTFTHCGLAILKQCTVVCIEITSLK